jgi:hypothetical protein
MSRRSRPAAERAAIHGSCAADAGSDAGSARTDVGIEWRSFLWRDTRIQHELSGGWSGQQQRIFRAGARGGIGLRTSFRMRWCRSFACRRTAMERSQGRSGGAVVNVVTKSGSNEWHGSAFYYLRDSAIGGAAPAFVGFNPSSQQHQFGGTVGGPIQRNKMFVFAGYDQHILHVPTVVEFDNGATTVVPQLGTLSERRGLRGLRSAYWRNGVRSGDRPGCPPPVAGGPPCFPPSVSTAAHSYRSRGERFRPRCWGTRVS